MTSIKLYFLFLFILFNNPFYSQIGVSRIRYTGKDSKIMDLNWGCELKLVLPFGIPINLKDTSKFFMFCQPSLKFQWYNFRNNLIVSREDGHTKFTTDNNTNHLYLDKFLKPSSLMQLNYLSLPFNVPIRSKKIKHLKFTPGFYFEYLIGGKFRRDFSENGAFQSIESKLKEDKEFYSFKRLQFGICAQMSYKFITVYSKYSFTPLFKKNQNIDINNYEVGLWINFYWKKFELKAF